jgi:hypothetical protein
LLFVMHMVARRRAGYIVRKHGFLPVPSYGFLRLRPMGSRRAPHSGLGQFGRCESRHSRESKTVRSRRGLVTGVRGIEILRTSRSRSSEKFALRVELLLYHRFRRLRGGYGVGVAMHHLPAAAFGPKEGRNPQSERRDVLPASDLGPPLF